MRSSHIDEFVRRAYESDQPELAERILDLESTAERLTCEVVLVVHRQKRGARVQFGGCVGGSYTESLDSRYQIGVLEGNAKIDVKHLNITLPMQTHAGTTYDHESVWSHGFQPWKKREGSIVIPSHLAATLQTWTPSTVVAGCQAIYLRVHGQSQEHRALNREERLDILLGDELVELFFDLPDLEYHNFELLDRKEEAYLRKLRKETRNNNRGSYAEALCLLGKPLTTRQQQAYDELTKRREERNRRVRSITQY